MLTSRLLSKNVTIKLYTIIILPVVLYGRETWSLRLWEENRQRVFVNRVLRRVFGPKRAEIIESYKNCIMSSFIICTPRQILK
jgi:hypothetical protein